MKRRRSVFFAAHELERFDPLVLLSPAVPAMQVAAFDDPLPDPESSPGTDPGSSAPLSPVPLPPSGPIGPGTS